MNLALNLAEHRYLNDTLIRVGIRKLLRERLRHLSTNPRSDTSWVEELKNGPIAEHTEEANEQHYEIPAAYFQTVLGPHLKYSCGLWNHPSDTLEVSEQAMLQLSCERAQIEDGHSILELGCGWGSLSLWMAEHYPNSRITTVSNSHSQADYIRNQATQRQLDNLTVLTADINNFSTESSYDRIVSVEMFEHVRNHHALFERIRNWLKPDGLLFVHIFAHKQQSYLFEPRSDKDWMSKYFFTGGIMPSIELLPTAANGILKEQQRWRINGTHYSQTLEAWLKLQDGNEAQIQPLLQQTYGDQYRIWLQRWRIFYMACSELFAYNEGTEWCVMHYLFQNQARP
ncbi:SAM-dependent methyltransferase [Coraliomargarita akajimensis]|uniref:Cyclopropane-fatty-acyl-phospholipid synthase n=1 Tax=Coraliomargarita akajimensis (strain DSM 45221 / IAM 15411 / JCM 23193 / KCTC 12865 / 04OKA010-24) TaxID=583355 RepID=D5EJE2_CORAD|nr:cyclopropane-fatty-acyl-phospholipid synthase family protein [Coraliomargarita akajimensis]ADE54541.1 Cyclopropane-fatty-acyl-phospholipid synthase [Coraliomargarita akajimensis DSM 45221]